MKFFEKKIQEKGLNKNITLKELYDITGKLLVTVGVSLTDSKTYYFNAHTYPNLKVIDAVRISVSIPCYFTPIKLDNHTFVDGGILSNYPLYYIDYCKKFNEFTKNIDQHETFRTKSLNYSYQTIGILTINDTDIKNDITSVKSIISSVLNTMSDRIDNFNIQSNQNIFPDIDLYKERSVIIKLPSTISAISFDLTDSELRDLFTVGFDTCKNFLR
jgi:NTE family protein